jgi:3-deoxy-manno-octulosonate cytidylyltransferase (CMP-KDO synthetase)
VSFVVVIPARYASTRLPGKLLEDLKGKSVLQHVYERAASSSADSIIVATDDERIVSAVTGFNGDVCMTSDAHQSGTQRIAEVVQIKNITPDSIIVNVQGDEPFIPITCIEQVAELLDVHKDAVMATLFTPLTAEHELFDSNVVKVVVNKNNEAMYFSRATIPWYRGEYENKKFSEKHLKNTHRHIGIYAYRASFIQQYIEYETSPLEEIEMLEQLRVLWYGHKIAIAEAIDVPGPGIDTLEDLEKARSLLG